MATTRRYKSEARNSPAVIRAAGRLGARVRALREQRGFTQEELAQRAKLGEKHIQLIEGGQTNPTLSSLVGLARALGVRLADLFDGV